jgi:hypothetical protein
MVAELWPMTGTHDPDERPAIVLSAWLTELYDTAWSAGRVAIRMVPSMPELPTRCPARWRGTVQAMRRGR